MLKRIKINGYKSLVDLDLSLKPLSVLFGPNAAGKSNLLDAMQLLSGIVNSRNLKEAFDPPCRGTPLESFTFKNNGIKGLLGQERASLTMEADIELSPLVVDCVNRQIHETKGSETTKAPLDSQDVYNNLSFIRERHLRYRIEIEILPKSGILRVADEYLAALNNEGALNHKRMPFLELVDKRLHLRMEGQAHPRYFERYLDHSILSLPLYPPHYPHMIAARKEMAGWFFFYFEPCENTLMPSPFKEVRHIRLTDEGLLTSLRTLRTLDETQSEAIERALKNVIPSIEDVEVCVNDFGQVELRLSQGDIPIPARVLSEGTLRILGLLALVGAKGSPAFLGLEEPENGIHPRRVRLIAELLKKQAKNCDTQMIITTHSPILPCFIPDEALYVCQKKEGRTFIKPFLPCGPLFKRSVINKVLDA